VNEAYGGKRVRRCVRRGLSVALIISHLSGQAILCVPGTKSTSSALECMSGPAARDLVFTRFDNLSASLGTINSY